MKEEEFLARKDEIGNKLSFIGHYFFLSDSLRAIKNCLLARIILKIPLVARRSDDFGGRNGERKGINRRKKERRKRAFRDYLKASLKAIFFSFFNP